MPMNVLIVDDEEHQRRGLIKHVNWDAYGMAVTGEAESAREALALAADNPPDLMVTDIRLLGADGLELSRAMRAVNKALRIIMITGYEEFEYAKDAIDIGIEAFLVKPINFSELAGILKKIGNSFFRGLEKQKEDLQLREQLKEIMPIAREKFLHELINGNAGTEERIRTRSQYLQMFEAVEKYAVIIAAWSPEEHFPHASEENVELAYLKIRRIAENILCDILEATTTLRGDSVLVVKCSTMSYPDRSLEHKLETFLQETERELDCKINIGVGPAADSLQRVADSFRHAKRAINQRFLQGSGQIIYLNATSGETFFQSVDMDRLVGDFLENLRLGDSMKIEEAFDNIVRRLIEADSDAGSEAECICLELVSSAARIMEEMGEPLSKHFGFEKELWKRILDSNGLIPMLQETKKILRQICDHISERKNSRYRSIVQSALDYIGKHYNEDLSLQDVAGKVYLSPSYLGAILRAELKQPFTEYLAGVRIDRAKELLKDPQWKLYEIAEQVGYQNPAYFCNLFKRHTGLTPKEFRNAQNISDMPLIVKDNESVQ